MNAKENECVKKSLYGAIAVTHSCTIQNVVQTKILKKITPGEVSAV